MRTRSRLALPAAAILGLALLATPAAAAPDSGSASQTTYEWPAFANEENLPSDLSSLADLVEQLAPQAGVPSTTAQSLAQEMRADPLGVVDDWYSSEGAAEADRLVGETDSIRATVTVLVDGNLGISLTQKSTITDGNSVVNFGGVLVDFFPVLHDAATYMVEGASAAESGAMPDISPMSISGCTVLPNSGGWVRRADCIVYGSRTPPTASSSMFVSYSVKSGGGRIDGASWRAARCAVGGVTNNNITIVRTLNNGSLPARVNQTFDCLRVVPSTPALLSFYAYGSAWEVFT